MNSEDMLFGTGFFDPEQDNLAQKQRLQLREGELREVTVLFADIKGFTNLSTRFPAEVIHARMDELMKVFSRCVTFFGGFVDKYIGDSIMALFGAKKATEHDTERAIRAALKMLQQLDLYNDYLRRQPGYEDVELSVRVGINTGLVSVGKVGESREGDFTVYGPEVNLASRMESNAPVGGIMLPASTKRLVEHVFEFDHLGMKTVKGIDTPVDCWQPLRVKTDDEDRLARYSRQFIGRDKEMSALRDALQRSTFTTETDAFAAELPPPRPVIAGVRADAGLGKSRLVYEFAREAADAAIFINGACNGVSPTPLNLFANLFENHFCLRVSEGMEDKKRKLDTAFASLNRDADDTQRAALTDAYPLISFLLEIRNEDPRLKQAGKDLLQHLMVAVDTVLDAILRCVGRGGKPLVFVLDDMHWLDESSAAALEHIINRFSQSSFPSMWVLLYRPDFTVPGFLSRMRGFFEFELHPLSEAEIDGLIMEYGKHLDLSESTIAKVVHLSAGNPFYLEEWCNYIASLPHTDWADMPVPANLHALILSRLDSLPQILRVLLQKAAVIGQEFFVEILKAVEKNLQDSVDVDTTLGTLEQNALIIKMLGFEYSSYFFKHITTREVAYQTLLVANRKLLHRLTAEAIEELFPDRLDEFLFALAQHYQRAEITDKALIYTLKAADAAARIYNNAQAIELYSQYLQLYDGEELASKGAILVKMADIQWLNGDWADAQKSIDAFMEIADQLSDPALACHGHRLRGMRAFHRRDMETALAQWQDCLAKAQAARDELMQCTALNLLGIWHQDQGQYVSALEFHGRSMALAEKLNEPQRIAKTLNNLGMMHLSQNNYAKAEELFSQSYAIAEEHRYLKDQSLAIGNLAHAAILQEKYPQALDLLAQKLDLAEKMNDKLEIMKALGNYGRIYMATDRPELALQMYERILRIKKYIGDVDSIPITEANLAKAQEAIANRKKD